MAANKKPPASQGADSTNTRNEYIPSFISKRPFWAEGTHTSDTDYLEHQRLQSAPKDTLDKAKWYNRGTKLGPAATKFRKGACENCGAMTHKTKECLSRPRKQGAKWTGQDIQADEIVEDVQLGWDAKRDRWNGYDSREYNAVVKEYEDLEMLKKSAAGGGGKDQSEDADDDARIAEETDMGRSQPTSTRQLRLREDTAAYLKNLDLDSARYDPKTRSMDKAAAQLEGNTDGVDVNEGFVRPGDDAAEFERAQKYAWETQENNPAGKLKKVHLQANPTEGEILRKKQTQQAEEKKSAARAALLAKYGDASAPASSKPKTNALVANERYVEYDSAGQIKGQERTVARSKYAEDVFTNNHKSVWGSWWQDFTWGYACCHSTVKNSYCTGEEGRRAWEETEELRTGANLPLQIENGDATAPEQLPSPEAAAVGRLEATIGNEKERLRIQQDGEDAVEKKPPVPNANAKKRTLQELQSGISEEELESYKRNRVAANDPMAGMLGKDDLMEMK